MPDKVMKVETRDRLLLAMADVMALLICHQAVGLDQTKEGDELFTAKYLAEQQLRPEEE